MGSPPVTLFAPVGARGVMLVLAKVSVMLSTADMLNEGFQIQMRVVFAEKEVPCSGIGFAAVGRNLVDRGGLKGS